MVYTGKFHLILPPVFIYVQVSTRSAVRLLSVCLHRFLFPSTSCHLHHSIFPSCHPKVLLYNSCFFLHCKLFLPGSGMLLSKVFSRISIILHTILHTFLRTFFFDYINMEAKMANKSTFLLIKFRLYLHLSASHILPYLFWLRLCVCQIHRLSFLDLSHSEWLFPRLLFRVNSVYFSAVRIPIALS